MSGPSGSFLQGASPMPGSLMSLFGAESASTPKIETSAPREAPAPTPGQEYILDGVTVRFPFQAYPSQLEVMAGVIQACNRGENALLESPTGSGKSLALLCSSLAWLEMEKRRRNTVYIRRLDLIDTPDEPPVAAAPAVELEHSPFFAAGPNGAGGASETPSLPASNADLTATASMPSSQVDIPAPGSPGPENPAPDSPGLNSPTPGAQVPSSPGLSSPGKPNASPAKPASSPTKSGSSDATECPKIYFASRTHKQVSQLVSELAASSYRPRMAVLASREHYCVLPALTNKANKSEECQRLLKNRECSYYRSFSRLLTEPLVGPGSVWDIEDLNSLARSKRACSYFASRELISTADIVFCPYNYIIDPSIRESMGISLENSIVIIDEAHNVEDSSRDAGSFHITLDALDSIRIMIQRTGRDDFAPIFEALSLFLQFSSARLDSAQNTGFEQYQSIIESSQLYRELAGLGLTGESVRTLLHLAGQLSDYVEGLSEALSDVAPSGGPSDMDWVYTASGPLLMLKNFLGSLALVFQSQPSPTRPLIPGSPGDFVLVFSKEPVYDGSTRNIEHSVKIWCLNPAAVFKAGVSDLAKCVILTSGTLSPMDSFASELGAPFPIRVEANHVIPPTSVFAGVLTKAGPNGQPLRAVFTNMENLAFQDDVGQSILNVCRNVPDGVLVFFASYNIMDKLLKRWKATNMMKELRALKNVIQEPRFATKKTFDQTIDEYTSSIYPLRGTKSARKRPRTMSDYSTPRGAVLFAVCRGKVSEGIDFSDGLARAVVVVGIPYPNVRDSQVELKRRFNTSQARHFDNNPVFVEGRRQANPCMNGDAWYEAQAFRAVNQALGRVIRHINDWGPLSCAMSASVSRKTGSSCPSGCVSWSRCMKFLGFCSRSSEPFPASTRTKPCKRPRRPGPLAHPPPEPTPLPMMICRRPSARPSRVGITSSRTFCRCSRT
ncbi:hypothetical protein H696_02176 [Fonticula alba]|uniref:Helicase ATP-binding domain-containing protein n=1 Tax=Fonticula alba TaxID=691883 RepID=A0A058ZAB7_FONAL|nr:hypothetical protein H696_02176 [Fonticula alba]KCV71225.1 hypothetical protein H696_02176 [Fonticula alba]|eukprot:XP_009494348.1 hypothetical protein H696_02176 [Fonticula alba]